MTTSSRRNLLKTLVAGIIGALLPACYADGGKSSAGTKPNIIFVLTDDLGYGDLGCFGQRHIQTPELDRLCAEGLKFTSHYSGSTVCAPSHFCLLSGLHIGHARTIGQNQELEAGAQTFGSVLKSAGYRTAAIGKWGLGESSGHPNRQGFDHWFGFLDQNLAHFHYPDSVWRNGEKVPLGNNPQTHEHYVHDLFTEEGRRFIRESKDGPFFLYMAYTIPHAEILVPEDSRAPYLGKLGDPEPPPIEKPYQLKGYNMPRYPRAARAGMISRMDRDIGRLRALLEELGLAKNTLIVFSSDNGPATAGGSDIRFFNSSGPLRGRKRELYEGGIRVPTIACWPDRVPAGTKTDLPSAFWDWLPTFAELAGAKLAAPADGLSLLPALTGHAADQRQHDYLFWDYNEQDRPSKLSALRQGDWKLAVNHPGNRTELFNLAEDIGEKNDLAGRHPEIVDRLMGMIRPLREGPVR